MKPYIKLTMHRKEGKTGDLPAERSGMGMNRVTFIR